MCQSLIACNFFQVLDLVVSRDERGRKVPEYLIHFFGWNSSWDRCVREEFILPYTEENRELQTRLANEAALSMKGKRKSKLPPLIKETLNKKLCSDSGNEKSENQDSSRSGSDSESSEEETEKDVTLSIPEILKLQLEDDWRAVTKKNKVNDLFIVVLKIISLMSVHSLKLRLGINKIFEIKRTPM
ncbi:Male-specific lethal 3 [Araneus ventricosus]|uniref:Male-specific lethal 3 n=1 Tax=Araneus ventricosus TaxID=182803 RepID=A0A4Y2LMB3_ARAVE|nr:Male-specific lethal 3 [Araneus ventricosus]